jgi:hypothetical protein
MLTTMSHTFEAFFIALFLLHRFDRAALFGAYQKLADLIRHLV